MEVLRELIEQWLQANESSQAVLAEQSGVKQNVISRWLNRQVDDASPKNLKKIAPTLGLTYEELLRRMGEIPETTAPESLPMTNPRLAAFVAWLETAVHAMTDQEWEVREPAARALFSVPPIHAKGPHSRPTKAPRRPVSGAQTPDDPGFHDTPQSHWNPFSQGLAFAATGS